MKEKYPKRLQKKFITRVAAGLWNDKITPFYAKRARAIIVHRIDMKYINEFSVMWWEMDASQRSALDFANEVKKFFEETVKEISKDSGIAIGMLTSYLETLPKTKRGKRKTKPERVEPIRKLRNPRGYKIQAYVSGERQWYDVIGEPAFTYQGYEFFIHYFHERWNVSDVICGKRLAEHGRYKEAIRLARESIEANFDRYIEVVGETGEDVTIGGD